MSISRQLVSFVVVFGTVLKSSYLRYPSVGKLVSQLIPLPMGHLLAKILPDVTIFGAHLSPGSFTVKEHVLVTIMATVGYSPAYACDVVAVERVCYHQTWNFSCKYFPDCLGSYFNH